MCILLSGSKKYAIDTELVFAITLIYHENHNYVVIVVLACCSPWGPKE